MNNASPKSLIKEHCQVVMLATVVGLSCPVLFLTCESEYLPYCATIRNNWE